MAGTLPFRCSRPGTAAGPVMPSLTFMSVRVKRLYRRMERNVSGAAERGGGPAKAQRDAGGRARVVKPVARERGNAEERGEPGEVVKPGAIRREGLHDHGRAVDAIMLRRQDGGGRPMKELVAQRVRKVAGTEAKGAAFLPFALACRSGKLRCRRSPPVQPAPIKRCRSKQARSQ